MVLVLAGIYFNQRDLAQPAPEVAFQLINGQKISLANLHGKPVMVVFWATTCHSCLKEIPHFKKLYRDYAGKGFEIIAVAMPYDRPDHVVEMQRDKNIPYPVALDIQGKIVAAFGNVSVTPNTFLIDPTGKIVKHHIGLWEMSELTALIEEML